jgi:hypothetical protein
MRHVGDSERPQGPKRPRTNVYLAVESHRLRGWIPAEYALRGQTIESALCENLGTESEGRNALNVMVDQDSRLRFALVGTYAIASNVNVHGAPRKLFVCNAKCSQS